MCGHVVCRGENTNRGFDWEGQTLPAHNETI